MMSTLDELLALQRRAFLHEPFPLIEVRLDRLSRLEAMTTANASAIAAAASADFGHRAAADTMLGDTLVTIAAVRHMRRHLRRWVRDRAVRTPPYLRPGRSRIVRQPLGVVGVISPWNYPYQLAVAPMAAALAAGNRVLLKPSELTARTSELLRELIETNFRRDEVAVVLGDASVGRNFAALRFDHLFFTGSTAVGRDVAVVAARNLTPVTLELGGKSPAIFDVEADFDACALRLAFGKLFNAGQSCVAPDHALIPNGSQDKFVASMERAVRTLYPSLGSNPDYTAVVSGRQIERLRSLVADARARGATIVELNPAQEILPGPERKFAPTLVLGADDTMAVMREEIFGPILPVLTYERLDDVIARLAAQERPLALYWFGRDRGRRERVLHETAAGGVTVNDTMWHFAAESLPFGGIGQSGMGAYHGERGFLTFTHEKPVFQQARLNAAACLYPPFGRRFDILMRALRRIV
jgi:coniferyl-aldehyde dehydrogenase